MTAIGRGKIDYQLQLACSMSRVLFLEATLLGCVCPGQALISVHRDVDASNSQQDAPSDRFEELK